MSLSEFELIKKFFNQSVISRQDTSISIGDDAAIINIQPDHHTVSTLTQWVEGNDYSRNEPGFDTGQNLLFHALRDFNLQYTNASWMTLSISLKSNDEDWLTQFSQGLLLSAKEKNIQLIGGDTSRGPEGLRLHIIGSEKMA